MKGKTILIIIGIIVLLAIIFFAWRSSQRSKLAAQAERDRMNQLMYPAGTTKPPGGVATTLDSVGGVLDSLSGLFSGWGWGGNGGGGNYSESDIRQFENECEMQYNTSSEVQACVSAKINGTV